MCAQQDKLRIAHCGGFHAAPFNALVRAVNLVASLLGHPFHWDTETVGCDPSLSSLPVADQRSFSDALAELAAWLAAPANAREFLLLFLDDQPDIKAWVRRAVPCTCFSRPTLGCVHA
jgi:hypothetical protein